MVWCKENINPLTELSAIIASEVPIAVFIGILSNPTSAGIIINPPPAPISPVNNPTIIPERLPKDSRNYFLSNFQIEFYGSFCMLPQPLVQQITT